MPKAASSVSGVITTVIQGAGYTTSFPSTENPISEGGVWTRGGTEGLDWQDPRTNGGSPGICYGSGSSPSSATDNIAILKNRFSTTKHYAQFTVNKVGGYTPPSTHEIELLVGFDITAHSAKGYEIDMGFGLDIQPVRWNGALDNYTPAGTGDWLDTATGSGIPGGLVDGDILKAVFDILAGSPRITLYKNGSQVYQIQDTSASKITSGAPGMGFFARPGAGLDLTKYCIRGFSADNA